MEVVDDNLLSQASSTNSDYNDVYGSGKRRNSSDQQTKSSRNATTTTDPWLQKSRNRMDSLNTRWNNVRLRALTLRSRLESSQIYNSVQQQQQNLYGAIGCTPSASVYSMCFNGGVQSSSMFVVDEQAAAANSIVFSSAATERASSLLLSLRELIEWIIVKQTEFETQQQRQQQQQQQQNSDAAAANGYPGHATHHGIVPLDMANVMQQKVSLAQLRTQLSNKRPIIDSSLLACHNFLRCLAAKRTQEVQQSRLSGKLANSMSVASIASTANGGGNDYERLNQVKQRKQAEVVEQEIAISREMQKLLEIWNSLQIEVEMRLQRLDDAHLVSLLFGSGGGCFVHLNT